MYEATRGRFCDFHKFSSPAAADSPIKTQQVECLSWVLYRIYHFDKVNVFPFLPPFEFFLWLRSQTITWGGEGRAGGRTGGWTGGQTGGTWQTDGVSTDLTVTMLCMIFLFLMKARSVAGSEIVSHFICLWPTARHRPANSSRESTAKINHLILVQHFG